MSGLSGISGLSGLSSSGGIAGDPADILASFEGDTTLFRTAAAHGLTPGDYVWIEGHSEADYNRKVLLVNTVYNDIDGEGPPNVFQVTYPFSAEGTGGTWQAAGRQYRLPGEIHYTIPVGAKTLSLVAWAGGGGGGGAAFWTNGYGAGGGASSPCAIVAELDCKDNVGQVVSGTMGTGGVAGVGSTILNVNGTDGGAGGDTNVLLDAGGLGLSLAHIPGQLGGRSGGPGGNGVGGVCDNTVTSDIDFTISAGADGGTGGTLARGGGGAGAGGPTSVGTAGTAVTSAASNGGAGFDSSINFDLADGAGGRGADALFTNPKVNPAPGNVPGAGGGGGGSQVINAAFNAGAAGGNGAANLWFTF